MQFFLWLLLQNNKLWTAVCLQRTSGPEEQLLLCTLCERNLETATHLFIECTYSQEIWDLVCELATQTYILPIGQPNKTWMSGSTSLLI